MNKKSGIYIDGRNFEIGLFNLLNLDIHKFFNEIYNFDINKFLKEISINNEIVCKNYYRGIPKNNLFDERTVKQVGAYINHLVENGINVYKGHFTLQKAEKGVDVRIALDMVRDARDKKVDVIYLFSNDTDLIEAVKDVKTHGIKIYHCIFKSENEKGYKPNNALSVNSDKRLILNKQLLNNFKV